MTLIQYISPPLNLKSPYLPFSQTRIPTRHHFRHHRRRRLSPTIRCSIDDLFKILMSSNPLDLFPAALTVASGAALFLARNQRVLLPPPEPDAVDASAACGDWILVTSPTPFNRFVLLRCPSIEFEEENIGESEKLMKKDRHYVNLNRGKILAGNVGGDEVEIGYQRVCVSTEDGGVISLDWPENLDLGKEHGLDTTVLIVPGTGEGSMERNVRRFVMEVLRNGCFPVVMNPRGCAGSPLTTPR